MTRKRLLLVGFAILVLVNGCIFGTLFMVNWLAGPTEEEIAAMEEAEQQAALDAIYAKLPPLEPFKSKINFLRSIGEAIAICETRLHEVVAGQKSWEVNMIESRYIPATEFYLIFIDYETPAKIDEEVKQYKVTCEVSGETHEIANWKASAL